MDTPWILNMSTTQYLAYMVEGCGEPAPDVQAMIKAFPKPEKRTYIHTERYRAHVEDKRQETSSVLEPVVFKKRCPICEREFVPEHRRQVYCCDFCKDAAYMVKYRGYREKYKAHKASQSEERKLDKKVIAYKAKLSQRRKEYAKRAELAPRSCSVCGAEYKPHTSLQAYCSASCRMKAQWERAYERGRQATREGLQVIRICKECGAEFQPRKRRDELYCSPECRQAHAQREYRKKLKYGYTKD